MTLLRHRVLVLALVCGSLTAFACSSSSPVVCEAGCLCVADEQTCRSEGGCSWTGSFCTNGPGVPADSGADAADAADAASDDAESGAQ